MEEKPVVSLKMKKDTNKAMNRFLTKRVMKMLSKKNKKQSFLFPLVMLLFFLLIGTGQANPISLLDYDLNLDEYPASLASIFENLQKISSKNISASDSWDPRSNAIFYSPALMRVELEYMRLTMGMSSLETEEAWEVIRKNMEDYLTFQIFLVSKEEGNVLLEEHGGNITRIYLENDHGKNWDYKATYLEEMNYDEKEDVYFSLYELDFLREEIDVHSDLHWFQVSIEREGEKASFPYAHLLKEN